MRRRGAALSVIVSLALTGCFNQGPMNELRTSMSELAVPAQLEPARTAPWQDYEWESLELSDGREALTWEGPRGIDNETAWLLSGWYVVSSTDGEDPLEQGCLVLEELLMSNSPDPTAVGNRLARCQSDDWPVRRTYTVRWTTTTDERDFEVTAALHRARPDRPWAVTVTVSE